MKAGIAIKKLDPRGLRNKLIFQRNTAPRNSSGGFGESWVTAFTVRGNVEGISPRLGGGEYMPADWTTSINHYLCQIYWRPDVTEQMRFLLADVPAGLQANTTASLTAAGYRVFLVTDAPQISKEDRFMEIFCQEVKS